MPLTIEQLQEMLAEHRQKLDALRQAARETENASRRQALEEAATLSEELVQNLQAELDAAQKAHILLAH
jgi:hypothetical protein